MPENRSLAGVLSRGLSPGDVRLLGPVVLCAEPGSDAALIRNKVGRTVWPAPVLSEPMAAAHVAVERGSRLIMVSGRAQLWLVRAVAALSTHTDIPVAVVDVDVRGDLELSLLSAGANLVIGREVSPREFAARLLALARAHDGDDSMQVRWMHAGQLSVDLATRDCLFNGEPLSLSRLEFELLVALMSSGGRTVDHAALVNRLGDWASESGANALRLSVTRLRKKLGDSTVSPDWIATVRGVGYRFVPAVSEVGDNQNEDRIREALARLTTQSDALGALADSLTVASGTGADAVAATIVNWAVNRGFADACTVFQLLSGGDNVELLASAGMSASWLQEIARGHPVSDAFIGSQVYRSGQIIQLSDMSNVSGRFPVTAKMSSAEELHACVLFPLHVDGKVWGDLAFLSRSAKAFSPMVTAYFRTVATIVSLALAVGEGGAEVSGIA